ncbi:hypothetical protein NL676_039213 [Syzygium grande]|nr:hypothetical protein NL676_039213 [Syzygium grande]
MRNPAKFRERRPVGVGTGVSRREDDGPGERRRPRKFRARRRPICFRNRKLGKTTGRARTNKTGDGDRGFEFAFVCTNPDYSLASRSCRRLEQLDPTHHRRRRGCLLCETLIKFCDKN